MHQNQLNNIPSIVGKKRPLKKKGSCLRWKIITIISSGIVFDSYVMFCLGKFGSSGLFETLQSWTPTGITNTNVCQYVQTAHKVSSPFLLDDCADILWRLFVCLFVTFVCLSVRDVWLSDCLWGLFVCQFVTFVCLSVRDLCLSVCSWNFLDIMFSTKLKFAV